MAYIQAGRVALDLDRPEDACDALSDAVADLSAGGEMVHAAYARVVEAAMADALHGRALVDLERPAEAEVVLAAALERLPEDAAGPRGQIEALLAQIRT